MQIKLIVVEGQAREREMIRDLPIVIGRSRAAGVTVGDPKVSRQHCFLEEHGGMVMLRDNGSLNGTLIDGQRVQGEAVIRPGAKLTVGPLTFVVIYEPTGEGVQGDTGQMAPAVPGSVDFEALLGGAGDDAEADGEASGSADDADAAPASPPDGEATQQWLPPPAATPEVPSFLPPPAAAQPTARAPASPKSKRAAKAAPPPAAKPTEFDWLASPGEGADTAESAGEFADDTVSAPTERVAPHGDESASGETAEESSEEGAAESADAEGSAGEGEADGADLPETIAQATPSPAAKKAPKKKRSWWPFGKKKKPAAKSKAQPAAEQSETASEPSDSDDEETLAEKPPGKKPPGEKPVEEKGAVDDTVGPAADTQSSKDPAAFLLPQPPAGEDEPDGQDGDDDEDFNQFFKGLKK